MRRDCDQQLGLRTRVERSGIVRAPHKAGGEIGVGCAQVLEEQPVQPDQAIAAVELGETSKP